MLKQFFKRKIKILTEPLIGLKTGTRWFIKTLLCFFGHLVHFEDYGDQSFLGDPVIFALNHNCSYESLLVPTYLVYRRRGSKISFMIDWMFRFIPVVGWAFQQINPVYVYNKPSKLKFLNRFRPRTKVQSVYETCIERLLDGQSIGIFPEGTRNGNPFSLLKGHNGVGYIALHSGVPIVPVGIDFPLRLKKGKIPKFGSLILRAGREMTFPDEIRLFGQINSSSLFGERQRKKITDYLAARVTFLTMKELSKLSGKNYPFQEPAPPPELERFIYVETSKQKKIN